MKVMYTAIQNLCAPFGIRPFFMPELIVLAHAVKREATKALHVSQLLNMP